MRRGEIVPVGEGREVRRILVRCRESARSGEGAGDEDDREPDHVEHRHDGARALAPGRVRSEECPCRGNAEQGEEDADDERDDVQDWGGKMMIPVFRKTICLTETYADSREPQTDCEYRGGSFRSSSIIYLRIVALLRQKKSLNILNRYHFTCFRTIASKGINEYG